VLRPRFHDGARIHFGQATAALDFGGLFSGNAIGPSRSFAVRLTANF
jgi:hypothetical protein